MAHEVTAKLKTQLVSKDLEITVKTSESGTLGTLLISKGNIEWIPKYHSVNKRRFTWDKFAEFMEKKGKKKKVKRRK
jgi:hypothetical protein